MSNGGAMQAERVERLRYLLGPGAGPRMRDPWHAGRTVGRTLYHGDGPDDLIGVMDSRALAELVVLLHEYARGQLLGEAAG